MTIAGMEIIPSIEKTLRYGVAVPLVFILVWIIWDVMLGDRTTVLEGIAAANAQIIEVDHKIDSLKDSLLREARKTNLLLQRTCENMATTDAERRNCILPEL